MTDVRDRKAGGGQVDPDDFNAVIDAVTALQSGGGGGGSQTYETVELALAFDTPGFALGLRADLVMAVDQGTKTFTVDTDSDLLTVLPAVGSSIVVDGSTGNDGTYTVTAAAFGADIEITVAEAIPDPTADGTVSQAGPKGVHLCDLSEGDTIVTPVDGMAAVFADPDAPFEAYSGPYLNLCTTEGRGDGATPPSRTGSNVDLSSLENTDESGDGFVQTAAERVEWSTSLRLGRCYTPTSLWAYMDEGNGKDPAATAGECLIVMHVARAT